MNELSNLSNSSGIKSTVLYSTFHNLMVNVLWISSLRVSYPNPLSQIHVLFQVCVGSLSVIYSTEGESGFCGIVLSWAEGKCMRRDGAPKAPVVCLL